MALDPLRFEALIILRAPPLQFWSPSFLPSLVSSFGYIVQTQPYGLQAGQFQQINLHIHCIHPRHIPRHILLHQGHHAAPFDVILRRWRPLNHQGPPPPWNDGRQNRQRRLHFFQQHHHQPASSESSADTPPTQSLSTGAPHQEDSISASDPPAPFWVEKSFLFPASKNPRSKIFWTPKPLSTFGHTPAATQDPSPLPLTETNRTFPSNCDPLDLVPLILHDLPPYLLLPLFHSPPPLLTYPTVIISLSALFAYSPPLLTGLQRSTLLEPCLSHNLPDNPLIPALSDTTPFSSPQGPPDTDTPPHSMDSTPQTSRRRKPPSSPVRRSPRIAARPAAPRHHDGPKSRKPKKPILPFNLQAQSEPISLDQALSILQATGLTVDHKVQAELLKAISDDPLLPAPSTPLHSSVPIHPTDDGLFI